MLLSGSRQPETCSRVSACKNTARALLPVNYVPKRTYQLGANQRGSDAHFDPPLDSGEEALYRLLNRLRPVASINSFSARAHARNVPASEIGKAQEVLAAWTR